MGFCLFNNVAIAARYAQESLEMDHILIIDWDLHHGNGTQHTFEEDPSVLYFSTHQYPYYPGTGAFGEVGKGKGAGFTVNVPLTAGCGDGDYVAIFEKILRPIALEFDPDMILVSAGFDIYRGDPLGGMMVTPMGFGGLTRSIMDIADACCGGKMVITLEGGYDINGQCDSVKEVLKQLAAMSEIRTAEFMEKADKHLLDSLERSVKEIHHSYWKDLET
jgi:acetoin utilization deacetylase AcuC-like enzyme